MATDIRAAVDHAEQLIAALLLLGRNERGLTLHHEVDLAVIAEDVLDAAAVSDRRLHATLEPAVISGGPILVERLVANLVENAIRYNTAAGDVWITTCTVAGDSQLIVANAGPLISASNTERIFEPFQRLHGARPMTASDSASPSSRPSPKSTAAPPRPAPATRAALR